MEIRLISARPKTTTANPSKRSKSKPKESTQASREDWINTALLRLSREGIQGITIDALCNELNLTKGSFYWHFKNRQALLLAMADSYAENTQKVYDNVRASGLSDEEQIKQTGSKSVNLEWGHVDRAMRIWAQSCEETAIAVKKTDRAILKFMEEKFSNLGVPADKVPALARVTLATSVGAFAISKNVDEQIFEDSQQLTFALVKALADA